MECVRTANYDGCQEFMALFKANYSGIIFLAALFLFVLLWLLLSVICIVKFGFSRAALDIYDRESSSVKSYFSTVHLVWKMFKFYIIAFCSIAIVFAGSLFALAGSALVTTSATLPLVILVGMALCTFFLLCFLLVRFSFFSMELVDSDISGFQALKMSYQATRGNWWRLLGLITLLSIFGLIPYVGYLFFELLLTLALANAYRTMQAPLREDVK
jgi:hypothetical protein